MGGKFMIKLKGGEKMQKLMLLFAVTFIFAAASIGASSAATPVNTDGVQYHVGQSVAQQALADKGAGKLNLDTSNGNLLITTGSTAKLKGKTTEDSVQAIVDSTSKLNGKQQITYGSGNLLTINDPNGPLWYAMVSDTNSGLMAKLFYISQSGSIVSSKTVNIGTSQSKQSFQNAINTIGSNGFAVANIANLWKAGAPADLMAMTFTNRNINQNTIANYAETKGFALKYTNPNGGMIGSNYIITTAGGLDDDAPIYGSFGFSDIVFSTRGPVGETAFINYNSNYDGVLALMKGNDLTHQFGTVTSGTLSNVQYNLWLLKKLNNSPQELFTVLAFKNVNQGNINYLWYDPAVGYGHGISTNYINSLSNVAGGWSPVNNVIPVTDYNGMYYLGQDAFNYAFYTQHLFTADDLANGRVAVSLAPYYTNHLGTRSLVGFIDGLVRAANGALTAAGYSNAEGFTIDNILSIRNPWMWTDKIPAIFLATTEHSMNAYKMHHGENQAMNYIVLDSVKSTYSYNSGTGAYTYVRAGQDLSPVNLKNGILSHGYIIPAPAGLLYAWSAGAPYSYLRTIARVGCICSTREYDLAMSLMGQYPLGSNEQYILTVLTGAGETNRQISGRTTAWGVSSGLGTYYSVGQTSNSAYQLIVTIWNDVTQTGRSILIGYDSSVISNSMANDGYTGALYAQESDLFWHLDKVWNGPESSVINSAITPYAYVNNVNLDFLNILNSPGLDPIDYMLNYKSQAPTVSIDTPSGDYKTDKIVTITSQPGTTIYYTLDGSTPTTQSSVYSGPIKISESTVLKYIAVIDNHISEVGTSTYTISKTPVNPPVNPPINPPVNPPVNPPLTPPVNPPLNPPIEPVNPVTPATPVTPITPATVLGTVGSTLANEVQETTSGISQVQAPSTTETNTNNGTGIPFGVTLGIIVLVIVIILAYLGRYRIIASVKTGGTGK